MITDIVKVEKIKNKTRNAELIGSLVTNPIFMLLLGLYIVEQIPWKDEGPYATGSGIGSTRRWARSTVKTVAIVSALAPAIPSLAGMTSDVLGSAVKAVPELALILAGK
jgi:hypothetical protein